MKLLFYISTIRGGGAARVMTNLANQFANDKHEVCLVTNFISEKEYFLDSQVKRRTIDEEEKKDNVLIKNIRRISVLKKFIKEETPDIVVSFMLENDMRAYWATRFYNGKLIMSVRNDPSAKHGKGLKAFLIKRLYNQADGVVFQTEEAREWFGENFTPKTAIIMNQVANVFFDTSLKEARKNIVTTGKFMNQKNHKLLINAFAKIAQEIDDNLIIYGDGNLRKEYEEIVRKLHLEKRIQLPGNSENVAEILSQAKLFVMSSDYEGMPNSLLEAMAMGLPCVSTDCPCGGPQMIIQNDKNGILINVNDEGALAFQMKRILLNEELQKTMGREAKISAEAFRPELVYAKWKEFFREVVSK